MNKSGDGAADGVTEEDVDGVLVMDAVGVMDGVADIVGVSDELMSGVCDGDGDSVMDGVGEIRLTFKASIPTVPVNPVASMATRQ